MGLTFYYYDISPPVRSVDFVIHALGLTVQHQVVSTLAGDQFKPEFLKINPLNTIPAIVDDGFTLWESHAIMTYLVSKYGKDDSLYPKDLQKRAIVDQRLHYSNDVFYIFRQIAILLVRLNEKTIPEYLTAKVRECQENVEKLLKGNKFIAGDSLTVADFSYITLMDVLELYLPTNYNEFPLTKGWTERCKGVIKDFDKVNKKGADGLITLLKEKMSLQ